MTTLSVALTGNPNTGKSTIFNELTGARQKIGNWPGVTVDKKTGYVRHKDRAISIVDLPGTYSINARSPEEKIVIDYLIAARPEMVVDVVDSSNIERNLFLTVQLLELGVPVLIDLNMQDEAKRRGIEINTAELEHVHPLGNAAAGQVSEGETVERISVVVRTYPAAHPVIVLRQTGTYKTDHSNKMDGPTLYPGDVVYLLMYTGEGTYLGWHNGRLVWWLSGAISEFSSNPVKNPWARYAGQLANAALDVDTWYCLRKSDGTVGWTQVQFAGKWKEEFKVL